MLSSERSSARLLALAAGGMIALNYPLLALFSDASTLFGVPVLYLYLFFLWAIFILLVALTLTRKGKKESAIDTQGDKPRG